MRASLRRLAALVACLALLRIGAQMVPTPLALGDALNTSLGINDGAPFIAPPGGCIITVTLIGGGGGGGRGSARGGGGASFSCTFWSDGVTYFIVRS